MYRWSLVLVIFGFTSSALAQGWSDYELTIDSKFRIVRANSMDVVLARNNGTIIYMPTDYGSVGPICGYIVTSEHILLKHYGRVPRNLFAGDTFDEVDATRQFYFLVNKQEAASATLFSLGGGSVGLSGPYSEAEFAALPEVQRAAPLQWIEPRNPSTIKPVVGGIYFLILLGWPILLVGVALIALVIWRQRKRRRAQVPGFPVGP